MDKIVVQLGADAISFFRGGGGGANGNVVGTGLLDAEGGELRMVLTDDFFEVCERLNFVEQGRIALWER